MSGTTKDKSDRREMAPTKDKQTAVDKERKEYVDPITHHIDGIPDNREGMD